MIARRVRNGACGTRGALARAEFRVGESVRVEGRAALSRLWVGRREAARTLVELEPVTGRTNQLRIHCAHIGHPVVGDGLYGGPGAARVCLHARRLAFHHPAAGQLLVFERAAEFPLL